MGRVRVWRRSVFLLLVLTLAASSAGCWGRQELENQSLVTVMGVDNGTDKRIRLTARIAIPRAAAGGQGGSGQGSSLGGFPITVEGENILDALNGLQQITGRDVTVGHLTILVLGEEFARKDVGPVVDVFSRTLQFRPTTLVVTCREKAEDFVKEFTPGEETEPSVMIRKLIESTHTTLGGSPFVSMQEFINAYNTIDSDPWTPYMTLASSVAADDSSERPGTGEDGEGSAQEQDMGLGDRKPGGDKPDGLKVVRVLGSAVYAKVGDVQRMVGTLDFYETMAANLMAGNLRNTVLQMAFPESHEEVSLRFRHAAVRRRINIQGNTTYVTWVIRLVGTIDEIVVHPTLEPLGREFSDDVILSAQEEMAALLTKTFRKLQSFRSDPIQLGRSVQMKFATIPEWDNFNWPERFPDVQGTFDIKVSLLNSGFVYRHPYPR